MSGVNFVKSLEVFGVPAKEIPCIVGSGAPTSSTEGSVGSLYMDANTGALYKCVASNSGVFTWLSVEGTAPHIGEDGNWWVGETDTGVSASSQSLKVPAGPMYGDVNGDGEIEARDQRVVLEYLEGLISEEDINLKVADVNGDGVVDATDTELIGQHAAELVTGFSVGKYLNWQTDGDYAYYDLEVEGITSNSTIDLMIPDVEVSKLECMEGIVRVFVVVPPLEDKPCYISYRYVKTVNGTTPDENGNVQIEPPVKGVDYFTEEDKQEIVDAVELEITEKVTAISVTEAADGSVTIVNTLDDGSTENIVVSADANGNPSKLTYNGTEIPISWVVSE